MESASGPAAATSIVAIGRSSHDVVDRCMFDDVDWLRREG